MFVELTAKAAGLPYLHPYMNRNAHFKHGINFAVASSTAMSVEDLAKRNITVNDKTSNSSLQVQIDWMSDFLATYCMPGRGFHFIFLKMLLILDKEIDLQ